MWRLKNLSWLLFMAGKMGVSGKTSFSSGMVRIAGGAIALAVIILILTRSIINGFQEVIPDKIKVLWGDVQCVRLDLARGLESAEIKSYELSLDSIRRISGVVSVHQFVTKAAIAKTETDFEGIVWLGMDDPQAFFYKANFLKSGRFPRFNPLSKPSLEVLISTRLSKRLGLQVGDKLPLYLVQNPPRARAVQIVGLYASGLETELGREIVYGDLKTITKLNNWETGSYGGLKIKLKDDSDGFLVTQAIRKLVGTDIEVQSYESRFPGLLNWLGLFEVNEQVLMLVLLAVVGINILSALLVLIVERTKLAALLNVLGASPSSVRRLFIGFGLKLVIKGLLIGNGIAGLLYLLQKQYSLIQLDEAVYYVSAIPLQITLGEWFWLNFWMIILSILVMLIPTILIQRIRPASALRFS